MHSALILVGPTGIGKTEVSLEICRRKPCEIVSADSRQIYRFMNIGTSKAPEEILQSIPHHFIDILNPDEDYSAGQFAKDAREVVQQILQRNKIPLVVGGSGLYTRALLEGFFGDDFRDESVREQLENRLKQEGAGALYAELQRVDAPGAEQIHPHNIKRVLRSLEVYRITGKPLTQIQQAKKDPALFAYVKFGLQMKREKLYERINRRVDQMFDAGFVEEVQDLLKKGYSPGLNSLNSVGYKEVIDYLNHEIDLERCIELVKQNTRRYAKRQLTWFHKESDIHWVSMVNPPAAAETILKKFDRLQTNWEGNIG